MAGGLLETDEGGVGAVGVGQQLVVRTTLHNHALFHNSNDIRAADGRQAMRHHHSCATSHQLLQRVLHQPLALRIQCRGCLVEQEDGRVLEHRACNGHALLLTAAQLHAALAHVSVVPLGQLLNEAGSIGSDRRGVHLRVAGAGAAKLDVICDRHGKQGWLLADQANVVAHPCERQRPHVRPVQSDGPACDVVKALHQADDS
mmetsp:Transcript_5842/g.10521  ORF Transcript_5842/g.10521 Transcript_5842/m.10521 type:complete len:202 (-) Transcript_5842:63-668(-)